MAVLEFEGKSVEKAVESACTELHIPRDQLKYQVISHGSSGIFGLVGTKKALIRVTTSDKQKSAPTEPEIRTADPAFVNREDVTALVNEAFGDDRYPDDSEIEDVETEDMESEEEVDADAPETEDDDTPAATDGDVEGLRLAESVIRDIVNHMGIDVVVAIREQTDHSCIYISGSDAAALIGKKGQTLESLQYLVDKMVQKHAGKRYRITIDVEGYIETRSTELTALSHRLAEKALRTGKPSSISRLSAQERRLVHLALKNNKSVRTQSIGDGYYRKLVIFPKKKGNKKIREKSEQE